jgi:hypothetical protein
VIDIGAFELEDGQPQDLLISTASLPSGTSGTAYTARLAAAGGVAPYTWLVASGSLPPGMTLNQSTGGLSGTPSAGGTFAFDARVTDAQAPADTATRTLSITIASAPPPPPPPAPVSITTTTLPDARRNKNYSASLAATGGTTPYVWSIAASTLPAGLALNSATGALTGRATTLGTFAFTVQVRDSQATPATASRALSIEVRR